MYYKSAQQGFTLLEILVAVTIIGILSSILYMSFGDARINARNKALMTEIKEMQLAIEVYRSQHGQYPEARCAGGSAALVTTDAGTCGGTGTYIADLLPEYLAELPQASVAGNPDCEIEYRTDAARSWYKLTAINCLGGNMTLTVDSEMARCPGAPVCTNSGRCAVDSEEYQRSFAVYSLGGQCE